MSSYQEFIEKKMAIRKAKAAGMTLSEWLRAFIGAS